MNEHLEVSARKALESLVKKVMKASRPLQSSIVCHATHASAIRCISFYKYQKHYVMPFDSQIFTEKNPQKKEGLKKRFLESVLCMYVYT